MEESPEASSAPGTSGKARTSGRLRTGRRGFWLPNDADKTAQLLDFPDIALLEKHARSQAEQSASARRPTSAQSDDGEELRVPLPSPRALRLEARRASLAGAGSGQACALPGHASGSPPAGAAPGLRSSMKHATAQARQGPGASPAAGATMHEAGQGPRSAGRSRRSQQRLSTGAAAVEHNHQDQDAAGPSRILSPSRPVTRSLKTAEGASPSKCPSPYPISAGARLAPGAASPSAAANATVPAEAPQAAAGGAGKASRAANASASPLASPAATTKPHRLPHQRSPAGKGAPSPAAGPRTGAGCSGRGPSQVGAEAADAPAADTTAAAVALEPQEQPARQKASPAKMPKRKLDPVLASQIMLLDFDPDAASGRRSQPRGARSGRDAGRAASKAAAGASQGGRSAMPQLAGHSGLGAGAAVAVGAEPDVGVDVGVIGAVNGCSRRHGRSAKPQEVRAVELGHGNAAGSSRAQTEPPVAAAGLLGAHETDGHAMGKAGKAVAAGGAGAGAKGLAAKGGGRHERGPASVPPGEPARGTVGLGAGQDLGAGRGAQRRAPSSGQVQAAARMPDEEDDEEEAQRVSKRRRKGSARSKSEPKADDAQGTGPAVVPPGGAAAPSAANQRAAVPPGAGARGAGGRSASQVTGSVGAEEGGEPSGRRRSARLASSGRPPGGEGAAGPSTAQQASAPPARATRSSARGPACDEQDAGTAKPGVSHASAGQQQRPVGAASAGQATAATAAGRSNGGRAHTSSKQDDNGPLPHGEPSTSCGGKKRRRQGQSTSRGQQPSADVTARVAQLDHGEPGGRQELEQQLADVQPAAQVRQQKCINAAPGDHGGGGLGSRHQPQHGAAPAGGPSGAPPYAAIHQPLGTVRPDMPPPKGKPPSAAAALHQPGGGTGDAGPSTSGVPQVQHPVVLGGARLGGPAVHDAWAAASGTLQGGRAPIGPVGMDSPGAAPTREQGQPYNSPHQRGGSPTESVAQSNAPCVRDPWGPVRALHHNMANEGDSDPSDNDAAGQFVFGSLPGGQQQQQRVLHAGAEGPGGPAAGTWAHGSPAGGRAGAVGRGDAAGTRSKPASGEIGGFFVMRGTSDVAMPKLRSPLAHERSSLRRIPLAGVPPSMRPDWQQQQQQQQERWQRGPQGHEQGPAHEAYGGDALQPHPAHGGMGLKQQGDGGLGEQEPAPYDQGRLQRDGGTGQFPSGIGLGSDTAGRVLPGCTPAEWQEGGLGRASQRGPTRLGDRGRYMKDPYTYDEDDPEPDRQQQEQQAHYLGQQHQQLVGPPADRHQTRGAGPGRNAMEDEGRQGAAGGSFALTLRPDDGIARQQQQLPQHFQHQLGAGSFSPTARRDVQNGHGGAPQGAGPTGGDFQAQEPVYGGHMQQGSGSQPGGHAGEADTNRRAMSNPVWGEPYSEEQHVLQPQQQRQQQQVGVGFGNDGREGWQEGRVQPRWQQGQRAQPAPDTQSQPGPMDAPPEPPHGTRSAEALMPPPPPRRPAVQAPPPQAPQAAEPQRQHDTSRQQPPAPPLPAPFAPFRVPVLRGQRPDASTGGSHGLARPAVNLLASAAAGPAGGGGGGSGRGNGGGPSSSTSTSSTAEAIRRALGKAEEVQARNRARQHDIVENEEDGWTLEQVQALQAAYFRVQPTHPHFWQEVARQVPGRTAAECFGRVFASGRDQDERAALSKLLRRKPGAGPAARGGARAPTLAAARKWTQKAHEQEQLERLARLSGLADDDDEEDEEDDEEEKAEGPGGQRQRARGTSGRLRGAQMPLPDDPGEVRRLVDDLQQKQQADRFITSFLRRQGGWAKWHKAVREAQERRMRGLPPQAAAGPGGSSARPRAGPGAAGPAAMGAAGPAAAAAGGGNGHDTDPLTRVIRRMLANGQAQQAQQMWREDDEAEGEWDEWEGSGGGGEGGWDEEEEREEEEVRRFLREEGLIGADGMPVMQG